MANAEEVQRIAGQVPRAGTPGGRQRLGARREHLLPLRNLQRGARHIRR